MRKKAFTNSLTVVFVGKYHFIPTQVTETRA
jgi:hypothetical protein